MTAPAHRLVLIEGLPSSGKTITADRLAPEVASLAPRVWHESDPDHPIALGWPANAAEVIRSCTAARYPFHLWEDLVRGRDHLRGIQIMEARFCQNAACFALLAGDDVGAAASVSARIAGIVRPLDPLVVHLRVADPVAHAARVLDKFDAGSRAFLLSVFDAQPWLRERGLRGEWGFTAALRAWIPLIEHVVAEAEDSGIEVLRIEAPESDWPAAVETIRRALVRA